MNNSIEAFISDTKDKIAGENTPSVYMAGNSSLLMTTGKAMYQDTLIIMPVEKMLQQILLIHTGQKYHMNRYWHGILNIL